MVDEGAMRERAVLRVCVCGRGGATMHVPPGNAIVDMPRGPCDAATVVMRAILARVAAMLAVGGGKVAWWVVGYGRPYLAPLPTPQLPAGPQVSMCRICVGCSSAKKWR